MCYQLLLLAATVFVNLDQAKPAADSTRAADISESVSTKEIEQHIERLASSDFEVRRTATQRLIEIGTQAVPLLTNAKPSDREVAARIELILRAIHQQDAERKLAEIVESVRENEKLYRHIDFVLRKSYRLVQTPDLGDEGLGLFGEEIHRYVYQGDLFYIRRMGFGESHMHLADYASANMVAAFDGTHTRMRFGHSAAHVYDSRVEKRYALSPHRLLSSYWTDRSFSQMLVTKAFGNFKLDVDYVDEDVVDDLACARLRFESWGGEKKPPNPTVHHVWLARDRNYLPVKTAVESPGVIGRVTELRKIAPGVWFPFRTEKKVMIPKSDAVSNVEGYETLRVRLNPEHPLSLFRDIHIPYDSLVSEYQGDQLVRQYHQEARYHPSKTSLTLQGLTTDERLRQSLIALKDLRQLDIACSRITDAGLVHLKDVPKLEVLYLFRTSITGTGLKHLVHVPKLRWLDLHETEITDDSLAHLQGLSELQHLKLGNCRNITDAGLAHLVGLKKLTILELNDCAGITDDGLKHVLRLKDLEWLHLEGTLVSDNGVKELHKLKKLDAVSLRRCPNVTEKAVAELREALPACSVKYSN